MNNFQQPPPPQTLSFTPMEILNMRIGLDQIKYPSPKIKEAMNSLDNIIHVFVLCLAPGQAQPPTLSTTDVFPHNSNN